MIGDKEMKEGFKYLVKYTVQGKPVEGEFVLPYDIGIDSGSHKSVITKKIENHNIHNKVISVEYLGLTTIVS